MGSLGRHLSVKNHEPCTLNNSTILNLFYNNIINLNEESKFFMNNIDNNTGVQLISIITLIRCEPSFDPSEKHLGSPLSFGITGSKI